MENKLNNVVDTIEISETSFIAYTEAVIKYAAKGYIIANAFDEVFPYPNAGFLYECVLAKSADGTVPEPIKLDKRLKANKGK